MFLSGFIFSWIGIAVFLFSYMLYAKGSKIQNHPVYLVSTDFTVRSLLGKIEYIVLYVNRLNDFV